MTALSVILDIALILISLVLIVAVLMQQGQKQGLGSIAGGAESFLGKNKARGIDAKLARITKVCAIAFIILAFAATIVVSHNTAPAEAVVEETVVAEEAATEEAPAEEAAAEEATTEEAPAEEAAAEEAPAEEAPEATEEAAK